MQLAQGDESVIESSPASPARETGILGRLEWRDLLLATAALHVVAIVIVLLFIKGDVDAGSVQLYMTYGSKVVAGQVPYSDFDLEYPPLAVPLFALPALFTGNVFAYASLFALQMIVIDLIGVAIGLWALKRLAPGIGPWGVLLVQPLLLIAAGKSIVLQRFDLAPAVLTMAAIVLFGVKKPNWAWVVLGLATAMKLYPAVLAPLFILFSIKREGWKKQLDYIGLFALAIVVPTLIITRGNIAPMQRMFVYHEARGLEIESLPSSLLMLPALFGRTQGLDAIFAFGSEQLVAPLASLFAVLAMPLMAAALLGLYFVAWRHVQRQDGEAGDFQDLLELSVVALLIFMLVNKVLSAQYMLWLYPLVALFSRRRDATWLVYASALFLTMWIFPYNWFELAGLRPLAVGVLFLRNLELIALGLFLVAPFLQRERAAHRVGEPAPAS